MWTDGRKHSFIVSVLRSGYRRWPPKYEILKEAFTGKKLNPNTKRIAAHYICASCKDEYPGREINVDHIDPVVSPTDGFLSWDVFVERLFCEKENLQVLCNTCHDKKSKGERKLRSKK